MEARARNIQPAFLQQVGVVGRKTGFRPKENVRKDEYDMDDVDEFFTSSGSEFSEEDENVMPVAIENRLSSAKSMRAPLSERNLEEKASRRQSLAPKSAIKSASKSARRSVRKSNADVPDGFVVTRKDVAKRLSEDFDIAVDNDADSETDDHAQQVAKLPMPVTETKQSARKRAVAASAVKASPVRQQPEDFSEPASERLTRSALRKSIAVATDPMSPLVARKADTPGSARRVGVAEEGVLTPRRSSRRLESPAVTSVRAPEAEDDVPRASRSRKSRSTGAVASPAPVPAAAEEEAPVLDDYEGGDAGFDDYAPMEDVVQAADAPEQQEEVARGDDEVEQAAAEAPVPQRKKAPKRKRGDPLALREIPVGEGFVRFADEDDSGLRRSKRTKVAPLEFWKNERVVYDRRKSGSGPIIMEVVKREDVEDIPRRRAHTGPRKPRQRPAEPDVVDDTVIPAGFSVDENPLAVVLDAEGSQELELAIAKSDAMLKYKAVTGGDGNDGSLLIGRAFNADVFRSGSLVMRPNAVKPNQSSAGYTIVFFVSTGRVQVTVHKTSFILKAGSHFFVPPGNQYSITNVFPRESKLAFIQLKP